MLELYYKTRSEEGSTANTSFAYLSLEEKPKIYFACHSADFDHCFSELSRDILEQWDVAIWFDHGMDSPKSDYEIQNLQNFLLQVQIMVIAVTPSLLTTNCQAYQLEFTFANEHHIPILPIIPSFLGPVKGLASRFSNLSNRMHLLSKVQTENSSDTEISYTQKLRNFLSRSLLDQEQMQKIRQEFPVNCFLSYRKTDRNYANALMRFIHQNPAFQDVAIWFDEYLYAGESYNQQIQERLITSDLFLLLITPNIYLPNAKGEDNFVVSHEYRDAVRSNRRILPVLVVPADTIDWQMLNAKFPNLPPCVDVQNPALFDQQIQNLLALSPDQKKANTAEHLYLIGLAYLYGVQVELDRERAIHLIQKAAEAGLDVSVQKLIDMYRTGQGVARNMPEAIRLQEAQINYYQTRLQEHLKQAEQFPPQMKEYLLLGDAVSLSSALWVLGNDKLEQGDPKGAFSTYHQMLELCQMFLQMGDILKQVINQCSFLPTALDNLGDAALRDGDNEQAMTYYNESLQYNQLLCQSNPTPENLENLGISYNRMGDVWHNLGDFKKADRFYHQERSLLQKLCETTSLPKHWRSLGQNYLRVGGFLQEQEHYRWAEEELLQGISLMEQLYTQTRSHTDLQILSIGHQSLGLLLMRTNEPSKAEAHLLSAYTMRRELIDSNYDYTNKGLLLETCHTLSIFYQSLGIPQKFFQYESTFLELNEELLGPKHADQIRMQRAEEFYQLALQHYEERKLFELADCLPFAVWYCRQLITRGYQNFEGWLKDCDTLVASVSVQLKSMSDEYIQKGAFYQGRNQFGEAISYRSNAIVCLKRLCQLTPSKEQFVLLAHQYAALGDMDSDLSQAEQDYREALSIVNSLCEQDITCIELLSICYNAIAGVCEEQENLQETDKILLQAIQRFQELYQKTQHPLCDYYRQDFVNKRAQIQIRMVFH